MTLVPDEHPTVRHLADLPVESWDDPTRGSTSWQTLFSHDVTGTGDLTTGVCVVPPGGELAAHRHTVAESYFFLEGSGVPRLGDDTVEVHAGSAVMISGNTVHATRNTGSGPLRFFYVFAASSLADVHYVFD